ncbi:hypothetical protein [Streptomyces sp. NPDC001404]|uniref:hypothetical protein n=1 Tax=Streptomyces sp. NPDC001404 TaxID=3364571 RepID=UPI0036A5ADA9
MTSVVNNVAGGMVTGALLQGEDITFVRPTETSDASAAVAEPKAAVEAHVGLSGPEARQIAGVLRHLASLDANIGIPAQSHAVTLTSRADESDQGVRLTLPEAQQIAGVLLHFVPLDENIGVVAAAQAEMLTLRRFRARTA